MTLFPHQHRDHHGGAAFALFRGGEHRDDLPAGVYSVRRQDLRLTGARNSVPPHGASVSCTNFRSRRGAVLPPPVAGRGVWGRAVAGAAPRFPHFQRVHQSAFQAFADVTQNHSYSPFRGDAFDASTQPREPEYAAPKFRVSGT